MYSAKEQIYYKDILIFWNNKLQSGILLYWKNAESSVIKNVKYQEYEKNFLFFLPHYFSLLRHTESMTCPVKLTHEWLVGGKHKTVVHTK